MSETIMTPEEIKSVNESNLKTDSWFLIKGVSTSMFSVARHYGGANIKGYRYTYVPTTDELIRDDVLAFVTKARTAAAKELKRTRKARLSPDEKLKARDLFDDLAE